jgi:hypothetical protein
MIGDNKIEYKLARNAYLQRFLTIGTRKLQIQSNSVLTNSTGLSILVRYNRDNLKIVKLYVVKYSEFVITEFEL